MTILTVFLSCFYLGVPALVTSIFLQGRHRQVALALSVILGVLGATGAAFTFFASR